MENSKDVWNTFLQASNKDNTNQETNLIVLGYSKNCCLTLIDGILHNMNLPLLKKRDLDLVYYSYATVGYPERKSSNGDYLGIMHIHCINDVTNKDYLYESSQTVPLNKTMFMIVVDFKDTYNIMTAIESWLSFVGEYCASAMQGKEDQYLHMQNEWSQRVLSFVHHYQNTTIQEGEIDIPSNPVFPQGLLLTNLGVPLYIVCTNTEVISTSNEFNLGKLNFIQKFIRSKCLEYGASLSYYNTLKDTSLTLIKSYLLSLLYPVHYTLPAPSIASKDELFCPVGFDNLYAIQDILGNTELNAITDFNAVVERPSQTIKKAVLQQQAMQTEEDFLATLLGREEPATPQRARKSILPRDSAVKSRMSVTTQLKQPGDTPARDFFEGLMSQQTGPRMSVNVRNLRRSEAVTKATPHKL